MANALLYNVSATLCVIVIGFKGAPPGKCYSPYDPMRKGVNIMFNLSNAR